MMKYFWCAALLTVCGACAVPNLVLPTGPGARGLQELRTPRVAEWIEFPAQDGSLLRGVWIPAAAGAPVVAQFMEATVSATERDRLHGIFWDLPGAGYSLLAADYRGTGASEGARSTEHVRADARAIWQEALRRAGGDPARVVLRGGSLGTQAIATLLQDGARPGAVVLYGPVRGETVVKHFMTTGWAGTPRLSSVLAPWVAALFRKPLAVDLADEIARCPAPVLVTCATRDELLPIAEAELLRAAAATAGGRFAWEDEDHVGLCTLHHRLQQVEREFLADVLPGCVDLDARLAAFTEAERRRPELRALLARRLPDDPPHVVLALLDFGCDAARAERWLDADVRVSRSWLAPLGAAELTQHCDLSDPAGPLPEDLLFELVRLTRSAPAHAIPTITWVDSAAGGLVLQLEWEGDVGDPIAHLVYRHAAEEWLGRAGGDGSRVDALRRLGLLAERAQGGARAAAPSAP
jgi:acetyl esterase/lipase